MNIHDQAHQLARSLKNSAEYQELLAAKSKVEAIPESKKLLHDFRAKQWELQKATLSGQQPTEAQMQSFQQMASLISLHPPLQEYLMAEFRFSQLMTDIQKILSDAVKDWLPEELGNA
ncbi:YlbF family regulator [Heliobacterium chlorum]|uniref:UPF0342 protein H1S01_01755 n=1 Tax=Heliobacterium chlorum TaxID=2698 RepID=A0ABR7SZE1_HELCL|nr:YlbF family regulator [Heliobacterium chlorum]MBC9783232.1 YlbF family regulator [Heliobacterium chlorum]